MIHGQVVDGNHALSDVPHEPCNNAVFVSATPKFRASSRRSAHQGQRNDTLTVRNSHRTWADLIAAFSAD